MGLQIDFDSPALPTSTLVIRRAFAITFDGDETQYVTNFGTATVASIEGGPRGFRGVTGLNAYEFWLTLPGNAGLTEEDYLAEIVGADGAPGPSGYIAWDDTLGGTGGYPPRPIPGLPVTFVGPESPLDLGVMIDGDVWINTTDLAPSPTIYVTVADIDGHVTDLVEDITSTTYLAIKAVVDGAIAAVTATKPKDVRFNVQAGQTVIDEFEDGTVDVAWLRVDHSTPARVTWTEGGGGMSFSHTGGDANASIHALLQPGSVALGESLESCWRLLAVSAASSPMLGIMVTDGVTVGAGNQIAVREWFSATNTLSVSGNRFTNFSVEGTAAVPISPFTETSWNFAGTDLVYVRLHRHPSNSTWETWISTDGISWIKVSAQSQAAGFTPTHFGLWCCSWGSTRPYTGSFQYLRKVAA